MRDVFALFTIALLEISFISVGAYLIIAGHDLSGGSLVVAGILALFNTKITTESGKPKSTKDGK